MKRVNPKTNKPFVYAEQRDDGYFFKCYSNKLNKLGYFVEHWHSPKAWENTVKKRQQYNIKNKDKIVNRQKIYVKNNKEKVDAYQKQYWLSEKKKTKVIEWHKENAKYLKEYYKKYNQLNKSKKIAHNNKRKLTQKQRMPLWLSKQDKEHIDYFYSQAQVLTKKTGIKHHVDHIVPIQGKNVSGLHVPWNLQILTAKDNLQKSNHF
jgi:hypothetical protein